MLEVCLGCIGLILVLIIIIIITLSNLAKKNYNIDVNAKMLPEHKINKYENVNIRMVKSFEEGNLHILLDIDADFVFNQIIEKQGKIIKSEKYIFGNALIIEDKSGNKYKYEKSKKSSVLSWISETPLQKQVCEKCGSKMERIIFNKGNYLRCSNYPNCDYTVSFELSNGKIEIKEKGSQEIYKRCRKCGSNLIRIENDYGVIFKCSDYPRCSYEEIQFAELLPQAIGLLGELYAINNLTKNGLLVCRADSINCVGHSLMKTDSMKEFDCKNLYYLTEICRKTLECDLIKKPCYEKDSEFYNFNSKPVVFLNYPNTGDNKFRWYCAYKLSYLAILDKCNDCFYKICPIKSYLKIDNYIHNLYNYYSKNKKNLEKINEINELEKIWEGHPGRIDLFATKNNKYYCMEVKVNRSKLSKWQFIRLNWMKEQGFESYIVRVYIQINNNNDKLKLIKLYKNDDMSEAIYMFKQFGEVRHRWIQQYGDMSEAISMFNPKIVLEEFDRYNYIDYEKYMPSDMDVKNYNKMVYVWIPIKYKRGK